ncbi:MAG TPA: hypothetical protein VGO09_06850, partial [Flavisolibacter sp.]|nr:hypothetical protein [Flavisolibacter sp.]
MKSYISNVLSIGILILTPGLSQAQCPAGSAQARLSWDNLNYYYNSGTNLAPYGYAGNNYVSNAMEQTQNFAIGPGSVTFFTSNPGIAKGQNKIHTGDIASFTGADVQFTPTGNGQALTITFDQEVQNVLFTLYDIDSLANFSFSAQNAALVNQNITATAQAATNLVITNSGTTAPTVSTLSLTNLANNSNLGTATIGVAGPVKTIKISFTAIGGDPTFWLSNIYACVTGSFPLNYHQIASEKPFTGQPAYFLTTPDNNSCYKVDPATGKAIFLFKEAASTYINSFAYDQVNHVLYYIMDGTASSSANKQL